MKTTREADRWLWVEGRYLTEPAYRELLAEAERVAQERKANRLGRVHLEIAQARLLGKRVASEYCTDEEIIELMDAREAWYPTGGECPYCGESRVDWLTWTANGETVICQACRAEYTP